MYIAEHTSAEQESASLLQLMGDETVTGPSEAGRLGRPGPPHFLCQFFFVGPRGLAPHVERGVVLLRARTHTSASGAWFVIRPQERN